MAAAIRSRIVSLVSQAQKTATPAYKYAEQKAVEQYSALMKQGEHYVVKDEAAADKLLKQLFYTNLSRIPKGIEQSQKEYETVRSKLARAADLPLTELGTYALFTAEVYAWFCVGEMVGRGSFTGYL